MELYEGVKPSKTVSGSNGLAGGIVLLSILTLIVGYFNIYLDIAGWVIVLICLGRLEESPYFENAAYAAFGLLALSVCKAFPFAEALLSVSLIFSLVVAAAAVYLLILLYRNVYLGVKEERQR